MRSTIVYIELLLRRSCDILQKIGKFNDGFCQICRNPPLVQRFGGMVLGVSGNRFDDGVVFRDALGHTPDE